METNGILITNGTVFSATNAMWEAAGRKYAEIVFGDDWVDDPNLIHTFQEITYRGERTQLIGYSLKWTQKPEINSMKFQCNRGGNPKAPHPEIPTSMVFDKKGVVREILFRNDLVLNDSPSGVPAKRTFFWNGAIRQESHFLNGVLNNSGDHPAVVDYLPTGEVKRITHYIKGEPSDLPNGIPYKMRYDIKGNIRKATSIAKGPLSEEEIALVFQKLKNEGVAKLLKCEPELMARAGGMVNPRHSLMQKPGRTP